MRRAKKIAFAVARKQLDSVEQTGQAINELLEANIEIGRQIAGGHIDVKV